jgi:hypothetical protein
MMNILTPWPFYFPKSPLITLLSHLIQFHLHFIVLQMLNSLSLSIYFSLLLDLLILHSFFVQWSYLFHATHYPLIYSFPYLMFILSYLFILLTYLLCVHLSYHISPYFSNNSILWMLSLDLTPKSPFWFKKKNPWMIHAMYNEAYLPKSPEQRSYQFITWSQAPMTDEAMPMLKRIPSDFINNV